MEFIMALVVLSSLGSVTLRVGSESISYHDLDEVPGFVEAWREAEMSLLEKAMVPGLVVTAVQGDENSYRVYSKTYGLADISNPKDKISFTKSKFAIGSISKSFAATLIGILLTEHKDEYPLGWDTKVKDLMGDDFSLKSSIENVVTLKHILSHTTGTFSYSSSLTMGLEKKTSDAYCRRMNILDGTGELNEYRYNNLMYLLAECIIEKIGKDAYTNLIKKYILLPLEMLNSSLLGQPETVGYKDIPLMYFKNVSNSLLVQLDPVLLSLAEVFPAAGGLTSTGHDMARWIILHLEEGKTLSGKQLLDKDLWKSMHTSQVITKINPSNYSLGWMQEKYKDMDLSYHGGRIAGFDSRLTLVLDEKLGVFTSANGPAYNSYIVQFHIHKMILDVFQNETSHSLRLDQITAAPQQESTCTEGKPHAYIGTYGNAFFGNFTVSVNSKYGILHFRHGLFGKGCLSSWNATHFTPTMDEPLNHYHFTAGAESYTFTAMFSDMNHAKGRYETLQTADTESSITFRRGYKWDNYEHVTALEADSCTPQAGALITLLAVVNSLISYLHLLNPTSVVF